MGSIARKAPNAIVDEVSRSQLFDLLALRRAESERQLSAVTANLASSLSFLFFLSDQTSDFQNEAFL
jgi:hypothetical protein